MKKIKKSDWTAIIVFLVILQIMSLWCIDISISAMRVMEYGNQKSIEEMSTLGLTNGFFQQNPIITYHLSLFCLIFSFFLTALIAIHNINDDK